MLDQAMLDGLAQILTPSLAMITGSGGLAWFMASQFSKVRHLIDDKIDRTEQMLINKIEYHERHDDKRFSTIMDDLLTIKIRNATVDRLSSIREELKAQSPDRGAITDKVTSGTIP